MTIEGNEMRNNAGHGVSLEISALAVFANNFVTNNGGFGIKINNTSNVSVWNNTFVGNDRSINLVQDNRRPTSASTAGRDKRQPFPDPTMTWLNGPAGFANNIVASQRSGNCMLCVEDYSGKRTAEQMGVVSNGERLQPAEREQTLESRHLVQRCRRSVRILDAHRVPFREGTGRQWSAHQQLRVARRERQRDRFAEQHGSGASELDRRGHGVLRRHAVPGRLAPLTDAGSPGTA